MSEEKKISKKAVWIGAIVFIALVLLGNIGIRKIFTRYREIKRLDSLIAKEETTKKQLLKEINLAKTDMSYIERLARKELGLIQPGEIEYRFVNKSGETQNEETR